MPAVVGGHGIVAGVLAAVAVALLLAGRRGDDAVAPVWSVLWAAGALVVLALAVRWVGVREPTLRGYVWATAGAWVVVPLTWSAAFFASFTPWGFPEAWLFIAISFSVVLLPLGLAGAAVAWATTRR